MKRIPYLLLLPLLLSGCGAYKRMHESLYTPYARPEVDIDSLYAKSDSIAAPLAADTATLAAKPWRELFTDTCLQALIAEGLEQNTDAAVARLKIEEAQAVLTQARKGHLPTVALTPQAGISRYNGETKATYGLGGIVSWEADIFGRVANTKWSAETALESSQAYLQAVEAQLVGTIAESYYTLLLLDEQRAISRRTLQNWDETIVTLEALVEAGRANDVAVRQARASRSALEASIESLEESVGLTENSLSALLGRPSSRIRRSTLAAQAFPDELAIGLPVQLLGHRPDVRQAERELAKAYYATNLARAAFYPTLTLSGTVGWTNNGGAVVNPGKWLANAVAQLTAPLLNRGVNTANLKVAEAQQQEALLRFRQALLDAGGEVNDALTQWQTAGKRIEHDLRQIDDLEAATEKTRLLVRYTSATYLEVLTAQQALLNAQLTLAQDRAIRIQSVVHLYHALGGGKE